LRAYKTCASALMSVKVFRRMSAWRRTEGR
jgi:hypothetical protein